MATQQRTDENKAAGRGVRPGLSASLVLAKRIAALCTFLCFATVRSAAQHDVQLQVIDSTTAEPVPGASILLEGSTAGVTADMDGHALLTNAPDGQQRLMVSSIGYHTKEVMVTVPSSRVIVIRLPSESTALDVLTVRTTRTNSRIDDAPQKIEVLGSEDLLEEGSLKPGSVLSLLGDISSVQVQQTSAVSGASVIRMQGLEGRQTLLLRDGMPAYGGLSGGFDLMRIPPLDLQRVELLKGPSSTFNGGGAVAGTINFVTKEPTDSLNGLLMVNRSTLTETNVNGYLSGPLGNTAFTLFGGATVQEAVDVDGDGYSDVPRLRSYQVHPQVFLHPSDRTKLRVGMGYQNEQRTGGDMNAIDAPADTARYFDDRHAQRYGLDLMMDHAFSARSSLSVKGSANAYFEQQQDNFDHADMDQENQYAEAYWSQRTDRRTWAAGASVTGNQLHPDSLNPQDLLTTGIFGQLALHRARWPEIDLGLRIDHNNEYGAQVLPTVGALFSLTEHITIRANAGTGYQLPDRSLGYGPVATDVIVAMVLPNTSVERSSGGTIEWTWKKVFGEKTLLFVDQTFFGTLITDPLAVTTTPEGTDALGNLDATRVTRGIDNYVRLEHGATDLYLGYTFTLPEDVVHDHRTRIPYTPLHRAAVTLGHEFGEQWRAGIEASWSGAQVREDGSHTRDQLFMAAMVGWKKGPWNIVLNGENITDTRQSRWERIVYPPASRPRYTTLWAPIDGRTINLSVLWSFGHT